MRSFFYFVKLMSSAWQKTITVLSENLYPYKIKLCLKLLIYSNNLHVVRLTIVKSCWQLVYVFWNYLRRSYHCLMMSGLFKDFNDVSWFQKFADCFIVVPLSLKTHFLPKKRPASYNLDVFSNWKQRIYL